MAKQTINIGTGPNTKTGDPLRTAFTKTNENFTELYSTSITISQLQDIAASSTDFADFQARIAAL